MCLSMGAAAEVAEVREVGKNKTHNNLERLRLGGSCDSLKALEGIRGGGGGQRGGIFMKAIFPV